MGTSTKDRPNMDNDPNNLINDNPSPDTGQDGGLLPGSGNAGSASPDSGQDAGMQVTPEFQQLLRERGFKSPDDLAKSYRELETKKTELERDKRLSNLSRPPMYVPPAHKEIQTDDFRFDGDLYGTITDNEKGKKFLHDFGNHIIKSTVNVINKQNQDQKNAEIVFTIEQLMASDPEKFERLRPTLVRLAKENPHLQSGEGLKAIYAEAEKLDSDIRKNAVWDSLKIAGLDKESIETLKAIASRNKPPKISDAGGGGSKIEKSPDQMTAEEKAKKITDAILKADTMSD